LWLRRYVGAYFPWVHARYFLNISRILYRNLTRFFAIDYGKRAASIRTVNGGGACVFCEKAKIANLRRCSIL
jgi:hypothetical protein